MGPIDKKLYSLGYTIQEVDDTSCSYIRKSDTINYSYVVKLVLTKRRPIMQSYMIGESCSWGHHCATPLPINEVGLFYLKMKVMKIEKFFRRAFKKGDY